MLESEDVDMILPGVTSVEALKILQGIYHKGKEKLYVYVFELEPHVLRKDLRRGV